MHRNHKAVSDAIPEKRGHVNNWMSPFFFTRRGHLLVLLPAVFLSSAAGLLQPAMALYFGKFFDVFSEYATDEIDATTFITRALSFIYTLLAIGVATFLCKGSLFSFWLVFGEMQARSIRELLFESLLDRELEWYESRTTGVGTLLARIHTYGTSIRPAFGF